MSTFSRISNKADFDRFKSKDSPHRVALLVDRGVEGWNVPCLFSVALARKLKSSNNFVLQAASRCLRQVPGNQVKARIYISLDNKNILDKQLQETYGESFADITHAQVRSRTAIIQIKKLHIPPLVVRKTVRRIERAGPPAAELAAGLHLQVPQIDYQPGLRKVTYTIKESPGTKQVLQQMDDGETIHTAPDSLSLFTAAMELARNYHLDGLAVLQELKRAYTGQVEFPAAHLPALARQVEAQTSRYVAVEETVEVALALVKPDGFNRDLDDKGTEVYTAEISYPIDREHLLAAYTNWQSHAGRFGFHYDPYNFDSKPERSFFDLLLGIINQHSDEIDDIYFTGGISDPQKTDFFVDYKGEDGRWHRYTPDFVIRRKDGKCLIVEIKKEHDRRHHVDGEQGAKALATQRWVDLNPDRLKYEMIFTALDEIGYDQIRDTRTFMEGNAE